MLWKHSFLAGFFLTLVSALSAQWQPAGSRLKTRWTAQVNPQHVLPEYPRPIMERREWMNLNGLWNFAITPAGRAAPGAYSRKILVPFAVESGLSGIQGTVMSTQELWYNRAFKIPKSWKNKEVLLHFGAVDWKAEVYLNGLHIGSHTGGYAPFSFNITPYLTSSEQELTVRVWDPTDRHFQPRGKQVSQPANIVYTAVSGIWQTVWLEPVNSKYITNLKIGSDIDRSTISVVANTTSITAGDYIEVKLSDKGKLLSTFRAVAAETLNIPVAVAKWWSPDAPFLYDLEINLYSQGRLADQVKSYCAMRKISTSRDRSGIMRLQLNNCNLFQFGPLDQGWFPDGLYTAPTDEALMFDIQKAKAMGYNMIRKHLKVEPARWYTHCDRIGMLVWQDMPSGDNNWGRKTRDYMREYVDEGVEEAPITLRARENYLKEWNEIIDALQPYPCIVMWISFNEGWGQFDTKKIAAWTRAYDPSRLLNPASGGNFYHTGDVLDLHHYPEPELFLYDAGRANVLGEYGGIGYAVEGHLWQSGENFGYDTLLHSPSELLLKYQEYARILQSINRFSAAVYTQMTDVEGEVNGLLTYDRELTKVSEEEIKKINRETIQQLSQ
ncbi:beta-galactosidase [Niabella ginsenosidivorans]|uniref:Beta-galactosidase n=1 Tax=Niabella ginsenosidivorans TaxID=1176587 RepID=A0A1A9I0Q7_9BACT|nr:sugar-binding domain-containing protein [Niabella ginsenosidivorans]ANH81206.1 beta-galactosidase [Niabella ginsenosidivorans]